MRSLDFYYDAAISDYGWPVRFLIRAGKLLVGNGMRVLFRARYEGREVFEGLPKGRGVIVAGNHSSYTDPMFVYDALWPARIRFMAKGKLFEHRFLDHILAYFGVFPVYSDSRSRKAVKRSIACIKRGEHVGIFPEGTRIKSHDKTGVEINDGVALIAKMADALIVPVGIEGTVDICPGGRKRPSFPKVVLRFGEPVDWRDYSARFQKAELFDAVTSEVMRRVRALTNGEDPGDAPDAAMGGVPQASGSSRRDPFEQVERLRSAPDPASSGEGGAP